MSAVDTLPQNALMVVGNWNSMQQTLDESGEVDIRTFIEGLPPSEKAIFIRDRIRNMIDLQTTVSQNILFLLWEVFRNSLWMAAYYDNGTQKYDTFQEWVLGELPGYDEERSDLWDCVRIVESVLPFVLLTMQTPLITAKGDKITPDYLIDEVGIAKLKIARAVYGNVDKDVPVEKKIEVLMDMTNPNPKISSVRALKRKYSTSRYAKKNFVGLLNINAGTADLLIPDLDPTQVEFIRAALGDKLTERLVHLDSEGRALLKKLQSVAE